MADDEGYTGRATLVVADRELTVEVDLRGHFQPIDGRYHWYGRVLPHDELDEVSDPDPWRRYRITGVSTPPFALAAADRSA
jgi:hypothetical protein